MAIAITTAIDSKDEIEQCPCRDTPALGSLAQCQQRIDF